jgi:DNA polymerase-4
VGLAPNRYLAKVAADMQKPDGLTIIKRSDIPKRFLGLNIRDFPGVGSNMERRLQSAGIYSVEQLYSCDIRKLRTVWNGVMGERIYGWIRGQDFEMSQDKNQSIGHSHVLAPHLRTEEGARAVAMKLLHKAAYRLRKINCWAKKLSLNVSFENQTSWSEHVRMHECQDSLTLGEIFQTLWKKKAMGVPFKVSLTLSELVSENDRNGSFFENKKRVDLSRAMDNLNNKYNKNLIYLAGEDDTQFAAPSRIAFSNIPTFDNE